MFHISDNALDALIKFLHNIFNQNEILKSAENIIAMSVLFPTSLFTLKKTLKLNEITYVKFSVCSKCHSLYGDLKTKKCKHILFPANPNDTCCGNNLLKTIKKQNEVEMIPAKQYFYHPLKSSIATMMQRKEFVEAINHWRERSKIIPPDWLGDIYDGKVWKELEELGYFDSSYNLAVALNVDWFQPYTRVTDSVGVIYLSILNLPRHVRYRQENVLLVGIIPGPKEPKLNINSYLSSLVDELKEFWIGVYVEKSDGIAVKTRIALICTACDMPAIRKTCGFVGHRATFGCSKCLCEFKHLKGGGMEWSGEFGTWPLRTLQEHKQNCERYLQCQNPSQQSKFASEYGVRFTVLLNVPYFNPVQHHVIDPMHNLLLGTTKHMMEIWIKLGLIGNSQLSTIEKVVSNISCPQDVGRLPLKIGSSFSGFTADQWRVWTTVYSPIALKNVLPDNHLRIWLLFVRACTILCTKIINKAEMRNACNYLKQFCLKFIDAYGHQHFTPNMHMHLHLEECCTDYGSIYGFWCFAFERFNGILGSYQTNKKNVESQLMKKFLLQQKISSMCLPDELKQYFNILSSFFPEKGTLKSNGVLTTAEALKLHSLSNSSLETLQAEYPNDLYFSIDSDVTLLPKLYEKVLTTIEAARIKSLYNILYPNYHIQHFSLLAQKSNNVILYGQLFHCKNNRQAKNSIFTAYWPANSNNLSSKRICQINYFIQHSIIMKSTVTQQTVTAQHLFSYVSWYKEHSKYDWFGTSATVCKTTTEEDSCYNYIPLQRLLCPCAFGTLPLQFEDNVTETVLVAVPLSSPLHV